jgi:hypothetical protein
VERDVLHRLVLATPPDRRSRFLRLDELGVLRVRHQCTVDLERRQVDDVRRPLVVVCPRVIRAQRERPARNEDVAARRDRGKPIRAGQAREGERLRHRLDVLKLVLRHHSDEEVVPGELGEPYEHLRAHLRDVGASVLRGQDR